MIRTVHTENAPAAVGPYSQAIDAGKVVYLSGQIPIDPTTGKMIDDDVKQATRQTLENLKAVLAEVRLTFADVVKCEVFLADVNDFAAMNEVYAEYFFENEPARQAIEASALPKGALVEISCIAMRK